MIDTNRLDYKKELEEVIYMFTDGSDIQINHYEKNDGVNFYDEFIFNDKTYTFNNSRKCVGVLEIKRFEKRFSKLSLYQILSKHYNVNLPWGALTGIRPVKMARTFGKDFEEEFKNVFLVEDKKIQLTKQIIELQEGLLDKNNEFCDYFVGIPFCPSRCVYCSFISQQIPSKEIVSNYVSCVIKEIESSYSYLHNIRSIYVGGGTPVALCEEDLERLMCSLDVIKKPNMEFTVEAGRPDAITEGKLKILKNHGVTRVCVNPQTFLDKTLNLIGRKHTAQDVLDKFELVKKYGFDVNMDLIAGLPKETFEDFKYSIDKAISLKPDNITVHTLCLKKGSKLKEIVARLNEGEISKMIDYSQEVLLKSGYKPYYLYRQKYMAGNLENTGFTLDNKACIYNIDVMEETSNNIACGANAVSKRIFDNGERIERYGSPKDLQTYISKIDTIIKDKQEFYK